MSWANLLEAIASCLLKWGREMNARTYFTILARIPIAGAILLPAIAAAAAGPVLGGKLPLGYRDWQLISLAILGPPFNDIRAKLGNDIAIGAFRKGATPFPNGAIIVRLAWKQVTSEQNNNAFRQDAAAEGLSQDALQKFLSKSFVAGPATNIQFMVKDSKKYASTGGWGFAQFTSGKPDKIVQANCMACHASAGDHDFVFTKYSP
jgi:hypothetical protein